MKKITLSIFIVLTTVQLSLGQSFRYAGFAPDENRRKQLSEMLWDYELIEMDLKQFNTSLDKDSTEKNISIALPSGKSLSFSLYKKDIRSGNYRSSVTSERGRTEEGYDLEKTYTYRGSLTEGGFVRLTVRDDFIYGLIADKSGHYYIDQLKYVLDDLTIPDNLVLIYRHDMVIDAGKLCLTDSVGDDTETSPEPKGPDGSKSSRVPTTCEIIEVATDADYEYFQEHGSNSRTRILAEFNNIQGVYETTFDLDVVVVFQNVWTFSSDPYSSFSTITSAINDEIETAWQNSFSNRNFDVIQMFTGKNLGGALGRANGIGNVCNDDYANNWTQDRNLSNSYTVAHELGHNLGGNHPGDAEPTSFCTGNDNQRTVMCQGENIARIVFSTFSQNEITDYITNNSACLTDFEGNYSISGPFRFCPSGTFSINNLPNDATVSWSVSPTNALTFPQSNSTTFTRNGNFNGAATISATITSSCSDITVTKNIRVEPTLSMNITNAQPGSTMTISATVTGGNAPYSWYINGVLQKTTSVPDVVIRYRCTDVGISDLEVRSTTDCGLATAEDFFYDDCGSFRQMTVYPNPASTEIFIAKNEDTNTKSETVSATSDGAISTEIFDFSGQILNSNDFERSSSIPSLNVSGLKRATYFLRIVGKEVDEVHQIIVE